MSNQTRSEESRDNRQGQQDPEILRWADEFEDSLEPETDTGDLYEE